MTQPKDKVAVPRISPPPKPRAADLGARSFVADLALVGIKALGRLRRSLTRRITGAFDLRQTPEVKEAISRMESEGGSSPQTAFNNHVAPVHPPAP